MTSRPRLAEVAGELGVGYVAMHRQGDARTMQDNPTYVDVVSEISDFLARVAEEARRAGVGQLWLDPGIGFGKTVEHNVALLAHCHHFVELAANYDAGRADWHQPQEFPEPSGSRQCHGRRSAGGVPGDGSVGHGSRCQYGASTRCSRDGSIERFAHPDP